MGFKGRFHSDDAIPVPTCFTWLPGFLGRMCAASLMTITPVLVIGPGSVETPGSGVLHFSALLNHQLPMLRLAPWWHSSPCRVKHLQSETFQHLN